MATVREMLQRKIERLGGNGKPREINLVPPNLKAKRSLINHAAEKIIHSHTDVVGLHVASDVIYAVWIQHNDDGTETLRSFQEVYLSRETIIDGTIMNNEALVGLLKYVRSLLLSLGLGEDARTVMSVSGHSTIHKHIDAPEMTIEELDGYFEYEAEYHIPFDLSDVVVDYELASGEQEHQGVIPVHLVVIKKDIAKDYVRAATEAGFTVDALEFTAFSLARYARKFLFENYQTKEYTVMVNIDHGFSNLVVLNSDGEILLTRDITIGVNFIVEEIRKEFDVTIEEAERYFYGACNLKYADEQVMIPEEALARVAKIVTQASKVIAGEYRRTLDFFKATRGTEKINRVVVSGLGARLQPLRAAIIFETNIPVIDEKTADYTGHIKVEQVAVGLALRKNYDVRSRKNDSTGIPKAIVQAREAMHRFVEEAISRSRPFERKNKNLYHPTFEELWFVLVSLALHVKFGKAVTPELFYAMQKAASGVGDPQFEKTLAAVHVAITEDGVLWPKALASHFVLPSGCLIFATDPEKVIENQTEVMMQIMGNLMQDPAYKDAKILKF